MTQIQKSQTDKTGRFQRVSKVLAPTALVILLGVVGCSTPTTENPEETAPPASVLASKSPGAVGSMVTKVNEALTALASKSPKPSQDEVRSTLQGLGVVAKDVEVSISKTPTGLDVDAIQGSVKVEKSCVIGQVREGKVAVTLQPVLSTGKCFVGDQG